MIFNVSLIELILVLLVMFVFLGTEDIVKVARKIGLWINKFMKSESWQTIKKTASDIKSLPKMFIQEADLENNSKEINNEIKTLIKDLDQEISQTKITDNISENSISKKNSD